MIYDYDKDEIKNSLEINQIMEIVAELGGEPMLQNEVLVCKTICHGGDSHKLYYYDNTKLFRCYTGCAEPTFDIFELVRKVKAREHRIATIATKEGTKLAEDNEYSLPLAIDYVAKYFGFSKNEISLEQDEMHDYFTSLENYDRISNIGIETQRVELKEYTAEFLKYLPKITIIPWLKEGIKKEVMDARGICYDPKNCGIVIPHYDIDDKLIGIRERTLIKENEIYGKYKPARIGGKLYNHPLSFNLYNLNKSKENIKRIKKAVVFEGEKSPMLYASYFGEENDISVACCGSSLIQYQAWLLINLGVEEIIIAYDKQFQETNDKEFIKLIKNLKQIYRKYGSFVKITFLFDKWDLLDYKSSPIDHGPEVYMELFKRRVNLY